ncbi:hypothetical protein GUJ93_ZPchr0458g22358 [Zizania palustris]|uniref:Uncharacterized protein n=1 Tax=Zizania palustris TaxID=103762 RepID=A0A8J5RDY2_ZIZPA|nr:hypothetical protein GUJ93_ZPchr0458g22358 [Zizania palustris]
MIVLRWKGGDFEFEQISLSEDNISLCPDREDDLDSDVPNGGVNQLPVLHSTIFGKNSAEKLIRLEDDDWLNSTYASSSYRHAVNIPNNERSGEVNAGLNIPNWQYSAPPLPFISSSYTSHPLNLIGGNNIESAHFAMNANTAQRSVFNGIWFPSPAISTGNDDGE